MARSFTDAIGYVERNEELWSNMIYDCWREWISNSATPISKNSSFSNTDDFKKYALSTYGIDCFTNDETKRWDYHVVDPVKYTFFQVKYAQ